MSGYFEGIFPKYQCRVRKGFCVHHSLVPMIEKQKSADDDKKTFDAALTGLSKGFGWLSQDLLVAKLNVYGFRMSALLVHNYLTNRIPRTRINLNLAYGK